MSLKSTILVVFLVLVTWMGAAGISLTVVEITGGGPQGEQGLPGASGPAGPAGPPGFQVRPPPSSASVTTCDRAFEAMIEGLSTPGLSQAQISALTLVAEVACE